jgi:hypothetical protein
LRGPGLRAGRPRGSFREGANHPLRRTAGGWRERSYVIETSTSASSSYQGMPFRSGAFDDCSGKPPAICMSAMSRTPTHVPPIKAATTHQNETIWHPRFPWSRKLPGNDAAPWLRVSNKSRIRWAVFGCPGRLEPYGLRIARFTIVSFSAVSRSYWTGPPTIHGRVRPNSTLDPALAASPLSRAMPMSRDIGFVEALPHAIEKSEQRATMLRGSHGNWRRC